MHLAKHQIAVVVMSPVKRSGFSAQEMPDEMSFVEKYAQILVPSKSQISTAVKVLCFGRLYFLERYWSVSAADQLASVIQQFRPDCIHFDLITTSEYVDTVPAGTRSIASINDCYSFSVEEQLRGRKTGALRRMYLQKQLRDARKFESRQYSKFSAVHLVSNQDANYLKTLGCSSEVNVISNGVAEELFNVQRNEAVNQNVVFLGRMAGVNIGYVRTLVEDIWPKVRGHFPEARLSVLGGHDPAVTQQIHEWSQVPGVRFVGFIDSLKDAYLYGGISVVPIDKRCGVINKAIEAMAAGHAVVGFKSAFSGIPEAVDGKDFLGVSSLEGFSDALIRLIGDARFRNQMQESARSIASESYRWCSRLPMLEELYSGRN